MSLPFKSEKEKQLFLLLQQGIEISLNPLDRISSELQLSKTEIIEMYDAFVSRGLVRRFGAVFEPSKIGYQSILCASKVTGSVYYKKLIKDIKEVTHCYIREHEYNLWFTFTARKSEFRRKLDSLKELFKVDFLELPAIRKFKTEVIFNLGLEKTEKFSRNYTPDEYIEFNDSDISMASTLQNIELSGFTINSVLLKRLNIWLNAGALKRIALVPYHREIGYKANAMCVWKVDSEKLDFAGRELAKRNAITHCYERNTAGNFPYNLFAMMHADTDLELKSQFEALNSKINLRDGRMLTTIEELKKSSFYP